MTWWHLLEIVEVTCCCKAEYQNLKVDNKIQYITMELFNGMQFLYKQNLHTLLIYYFRCEFWGDLSFYYKIDSTFDNKQLLSFMLIPLTVFEKEHQ